MSFWENVNEELKRAAKEGWEAVKDSAKIGKNRYKVHTLHKKAEKLFAEIGGIVYDMAKPPYENPLSRPAVLKLIEDIKKIEQESTALEEEIAKTRKKEAGKAGAKSSKAPHAPPAPEEEPEEEK
ncbi:MAG TPA: hypothetical protein VJM57_07755 [Thermodesulfobacteriota bacterium]|nr:hypothetical protein [Thermodesulfobacteriota bacterium]